MTLDREAATIISTVTAALEAIIGVGAAFGLGLDADQRNAVLGAVAPMVGATLMLGPIIRQFVWSKHSVQTEITAAHAAGKADEPKPKLP
jgi:hypothetical protein